MLRLVRVEGRRGAGGLDGAEAAAARAGVAHEHDCGGGGAAVAAAPAVGDVGAARLLADRVQVQAAQVAFYLLVVFRLCVVGDRRLQPRRQPRDRAPVALWPYLGGAELEGFFACRDGGGGGWG